MNEIREKKIFNSYTFVFIILTVYLILYRELYIEGFGDFNTILIGCICVFLLSKATKTEFCLENTGRRMTLEVFICILGLMFLEQFIADFAYRGMEHIFNSFDLSMYYAEGDVEPKRNLFSISMLDTLNALCPILFAPIAEEIVFRGHAAKTFERDGGKVFAIIVTAIVFAIGHGRASFLVHTFLGGLIFAYLMIEYGIKWACIFHVLNNFAIMGLTMIIDSVFGTGGVLAPTNIACLILGAIGVAIAIRHKEAIKEYISVNRTGKGEYRKVFFNIGFMLFLVFNAWKAVGAIGPM